MVAHILHNRKGGEDHVDWLAYSNTSMMECMFGVSFNLLKGVINEQMGQKEA